MDLKTVTSNDFGTVWAGDVLHLCWRMSPEADLIPLIFASWAFLHRFHLKKKSLRGAQSHFLPVMASHLRGFLLPFFLLSNSLLATECYLYNPSSSSTEIYLFVFAQKLTSLVKQHIKAHLQYAHSHNTSAEKSGWKLYERQWGSDDVPCCNRKQSLHFS